MIKRLLRNIRQKPKVVRDNIALGIAGMFTAIVFSIWVYHFPSKIAALTDSTQSDKGEGSPAFTDFFGEIKDQIATLNEATDGNPVDSATSSVDLATSTSNWQEYFNPATSTAEMATGTSSVAASSTAFLIETSTSSVPTSPTTSIEVFRPIRIVTTSSTLPVAATTTETW